MSASTEKKNRIADREAGTDKKTIAAQKEAAEKKKSKRRWTITLISIVLVIALVLVLDSPLMYKATTAVEVNGTKLSPAEFSYHYANQYSNFAQQYGDYASMFGLDTSSGIAGLRTQACSMTENGTWRDYFIDAALSEVSQTRALVDYANTNGITLSAEETAAIDSEFESIDMIASAYGYPNANKFLAANYGTGVNKEIVRASALESALATAAYEAKEASFTYTDAELEEKYASYEGAKDIYTFATYFVSASEDSGVTLDEAKATANEILKAYKDGKEEDVYARFNAACESVTGTGCTKGMDAKENLLESYKEWLTGSRKAGDADVFENSGATGCYAVLFLDSTDNHYRVAQVRHILVKAVADENGVYTDEAKAAAKATAEELLAQWKAGEATEESFAALATEKSEDEGSKSNGGLYDTVMKGQMVDEFDRFCFEGHKAGDTGIVYGESASYAGYHVMYYVGEGDLYSNIVAENDLLSTAMSEWFEALVAPYEPVKGFGMKLVG